MKIQAKFINEARKEYTITRTHNSVIVQPASGPAYEIPDTHPKFGTVAQKAYSMFTGWDKQQLQALSELHDIKVKRLEQQEMTARQQRKEAIATHRAKTKAQNPNDDVLRLNWGGKEYRFLLQANKSSEGYTLNYNEYPPVSMPMTISYWPLLREYWQPASGWNVKAIREHLPTLTNDLRDYQKQVKAHQQRAGQKALVVPLSLEEREIANKAGFTDEQLLRLVKLFSQEQAAEIIRLRLRQRGMGVAHGQ